MSNDKASSTPHAANRLARLAAVQALYENSFEQETVKEIIRHSIDNAFAGLRDNEDGSETITEKPNKELFGQIVEGVVANKDDLDAMIGGALDTKKSRERMEVLLQMILRAGAFELHHQAHIPEGIIINDYVDVTRAFYNAKEPGLVNAVLDKLAGKLR